MLSSRNRARRLIAGLGLLFPAWPCAASSGAGWLNDGLREESPGFDPWDLGGQVRARFEDKSDFAVPSRQTADFQRHGDSENLYQLFRERVHAGWKPIQRFEVFGEMQDSTALGDDRSPSPDTDHLSLRQSWLSWDGGPRLPLAVKAGRQELAYGDQRLIGVADWLNFGRTYDAAKLRYGTADSWIDAFVARPVLPFLQGFDHSDGHDDLSGLYASSRKLVPVQESQLYFLARDVGVRPASEAALVSAQYAPASPRDIYTIGSRAQSLPGAVGGWDYNAEGDYQFGRFQASATSPRLVQEAFALHALGGYTWTQAAGTPRLGLEYNFASGSGATGGGKHGTFDNLYPSNHGLYGIMDFFSLQNMHDLHAGASVKPSRKLLLKLDGHAFWLASTSDSFYQGNGVARATDGYGVHPGFDSYVGSELDLVASYALARFANLQAGYGHFFVGDYVTESLSGHGGATDANYVYAQLTLNL